MSSKKLLLLLLITVSVAVYAEENQAMELDNTSPQPSSATIVQPQATNNEQLVSAIIPTKITNEQESKDFASAWGVGLQVSTLGVGINVAHALYDDYLDIRGQYNFLPMGQQTIAGNSMGVNFNTIGLLLDYKPFGGVFRFTGGLYYDGRNISTSGNNLDINGTSASGNTGINFPTIAPYLGVGVGSYGASTMDKKGLLVAFDAGVLFSKAKAYANVQCTGADCSSFTTNTQDYINGLNNSFAAFPFYPVLSIGVGYRF